MNKVILVGRIANIEKGDITQLTIGVNRPFKNIDGDYETDLIPCLVFGNFSSTVNEYCEIGDVVGINGRIQIKDNQIQIIAEKVTFLSSRKED